MIARARSRDPDPALRDRAGVHARGVRGSEADRGESPARALDDGDARARRGRPGHGGRAGRGRDARGAGAWSAGPVGAAEARAATDRGAAAERGEGGPTGAAGDAGAAQARGPAEARPLGAGGLAGADEARGPRPRRLLDEAASPAPRAGETRLRPRRPPPPRAAFRARARRGVAALAAVAHRARRGAVCSGSRAWPGRWSPAAERDPKPTPTPTPSPTPHAHAHPEPDPGRRRRPSRPKTPTPEPTQTPAAASQEARRVEAAVRRHWRLIEAGRYADAYDRFAPELAKRATGGRAGSRASGGTGSTARGRRRADDHVGHHGDRARRAPADQRGAQRLSRWSGTYDLRKVSGTWRISTAGLKSRSC